MKRSLYLFLTLLFVFLLMPKEINANFAGFCMYEHPTNSNLKIGVDRNGGVHQYDFSTSNDPEPDSFANSVHTNFSSEIQDSDTYKAGHSFDGFGSCPQKLSYITGPGGEVFFHPFVEEVVEIIDTRGDGFFSPPTVKFDDSRIVGTEFPFAKDIITINRGHCWLGDFRSGHRVDGMTFREAETFCRDIDSNYTFSMDSYDLGFSWNNWSNLSREEVDELDEQRAREDRDQAYDELYSCWLEHGYDDVNGRNVITDCFQEANEETEAAAACVRREIGDNYRCGGEHLNYEEKESTYTDKMQASWITIDLTELTCEQLLGEHNSEIRQFILRIFYLIVGLGMAILITMSALDYAKVVSGGSEDSDLLAKAHKRVFTRLGIFALLIFLPIIVLFVFEIFGDILGIYENCLDELF